MSINLRQLGHVWDKISFFFTLLVVPSFCFGSSGEMAHSVNYYQILLTKLGFDIHDLQVGEYMAIPGALFILGVITVIGARYRSYVAKKIEKNDLSPDASFSINGFVDFISDFLMGITRDQIPHGYEKHLPLVFTIFIFILTSNLIGLVPGFNSPTSFISMNLAMGIMTFVVYNYSGFKENGVAYLKHFTGPVAFIAPLFVIIELVGHLVRPYSLSLRLMGNLFGDHLVLAVFTNLTWVLIPALFVFFGLLVAFVQSYIFTLLTVIYISLAVSHDH